MKIHREGYQTIIFGGGIFFLINLSFFFLLSFSVFLLILIISMIFFTGLVLFFRIPERKYNTSNGNLVSPADGKVLEIRQVFENEYFKKPMTRISIFMSLLDVHLNRIPVNGKIVYVQYHPGRYFFAFHPKSSELNEHNTIVIEAENGKEILVRQIAGGLARRIRCFVEENQIVKVSDEMGFIKFGSRADVFIPDSYTTVVGVGQKVKAGVSILAKTKEN